MNHTPNYNLNQWEAEDKIQRTDFNADNAKIDGALARKGNCQIITGSYVGTGAAGRNAPTVVTFPAKPLVVFIHPNGIPVIAFYGFAYGMHLGQSQGHTTTLNTMWEGNTLSFYDRSSDASPSSQLNEAGRTYHYTIFAEA